MNPYETLGISKTSSTDEIHKAYEILVQTSSKESKENNYYNDKLIEVNEAYRIITQTLSFEEARDLIENENFIAAESKLNLTPDINSAQWNYLKGLLFLKKGWFDSAITHIRKAVSLSPNNYEYLETMTLLNEKVMARRSAYSTTSKNTLLNRFKFC